MTYGTFLSYVVPAVLAMALSGVYAIVDGFFVGNRIGDPGLSAINFAYPVTAFLEAVGTGIGMGGAVHYALSMGRGRRELARQYGVAVLWGLLAAGAVLSLVLWLTAEPMLYAMGARGELLRLGTEYNQVITAGGFLQILGVGLVPLLRNRAGSFLATAVMTAGFVLNILLDYLFVWQLDWGMTGAALATIIGQGAAALLGAGLLLRAGGLDMRLPASGRRGLFQDILSVGAAPFGLSITPNASLVLMNGFSAAYGGDFAVAVYAVVAYSICIVYLALHGVGEGSQPLMSRCCGRRDWPGLFRVQRWAAGSALLLAAGSGVIFWRYGVEISLFMGVSPAAAAASGAVYPVFSASLPFMALNRVVASSFYAVGQSRPAQCLSWAEPVFLGLFLLVLPPFGGQTLVWWSVTLARAAAAVLAAGLWMRCGGARGETAPESA